VADLGLAEFLRRPSKEGSELMTVEEIVPACCGPETAQDQLLFHAVT
jgi:hypothetical protein